LTSLEAVIAVSVLYLKTVP